MTCNIVLVDGASLHYYFLTGRGTQSIHSVKLGTPPDGGILAQIHILIGTMTGTAEMVAEEIADELKADGHDVDVEPMDGLDSGVFQPGPVYLICTSTYGQGDVPDNATGLFEDLESTAPDLSAISYGLISLGDRTYADTFCFGGQKFDDLLTKLKATRIGTPMEHDASDGTIPEEVGIEWAREWVGQIESAEAA